MIGDVDDHASSDPQQAETAKKEKANGMSDP